MEPEKESNLHAVEAVARGSMGRSATAGRWIDRFLRFACVAGFFSGGVGLSLYGEALRQGRKSEARI